MQKSGTEKKGLWNNLKLSASAQISYKFRNKFYAQISTNIFARIWVFGIIRMSVILYFKPITRFDEDEKFIHNFSAYVQKNRDNKQRYISCLYDICCSGDVDEWLYDHFKQCRLLVKGPSISYPATDPRSPWDWRTCYTGSNRASFEIYFRITSKIILDPQNSPWTWFHSEFFLLQKWEFFVYYKGLNIHIYF